MRLLDLFCGAGGAAMGYSRAGFTEIVGVDIGPQLRYPFTFVCDDALDFCAQFGHTFDAIHASPPCQKYSWSARRWTDVARADLVGPTREVLHACGVPWVIENVIGAPLARQVELCGTMFGLTVIRHRRFESSVFMLAPSPCAHLGTVRNGAYVTVAGHGGDNISGRGSRAAKQAAMGIDWMNDQELNEANPAGLHRVHRAAALTGAARAAGRGRRRGRSATGVPHLTPRARSSSSSLWRPLIVGETMWLTYFRGPSGDQGPVWTCCAL